MQAFEDVLQRPVRNPIDEWPDRARFGLATALQQLGRFKEAEEIWRRIRPEFVDAAEWINNVAALGAAYYDAGLFADAQRIFGAALEFEPENADLKLRLQTAERAATLKP